ncbi:RagB/SusD family nutrient uptake outer membrane protein [Chitinophaga sp. NPDC101104]|uniref:RagB/SusD family nutrient uptake outer membrane protein n=1 Tax=Chitinophaga sp. NPDC101104 TaxID=3390561 RepID=UPI003D05404F
MKRIFFSLQALAILIGAAGCHDALLNMKPESILTTTNYFRSSSEMNKAVIGIYSNLQARRMTDYIIMDAPSDNLYMSTNTPIAGAVDLDGLTMNTENNVLGNFWESNYAGIYRANQVLLNIDKPTDYAGSAKNQFIGEAKFLRALLYFDMVRTFGGVPLVTTQISIEEARAQRRASVDEVYNLIIADLKDAVEKLPPAANMEKGRTSKGAATALLGKVYIYRKDYNNAKEVLNKAVNDFGYNLVPNFATLWDPATEDNSEVVFTMKYVESVNGQTLSTAFIPNGGVYGIVERGVETALPSWSLNKRFVAGDTRKAKTITDWLVTPTAPNDPPTFYPYVSKYANKHLYNTSGLDLPVIRFAEVLLLQSEALYNTGDKAGALTALNRVRERAFAGTGHNYTAGDIANANDFLDKLLLERQLELAFEGDRWYDLVRTGKYLTVMTQEERLYVPANNAAETVTLSPKAYMTVFPIPQRQVDQYNPGVMDQNEGYKK